MRSWLVVAVVSSSVLGAGCRWHTLEDSAYQFSFTEVLRDDCDLATSPGVQSVGTLRTTGNIVAMRYGYLGLELNGIYRFSEEQMVLDGTVVNVNTTVRGHACLLDTAAIHLETVTQTSDAFVGEMQISLDAKLNPETCACRFWAKFSAVRQ